MGMNYVLAVIGVLVFSIGITFVATRRRANKQLSEFSSLTQAVSQTRKALNESERELSKNRDIYARIFADTAKLKELKNNADSIAIQLQTDTDLLHDLKEKILVASDELKARNTELHELMSKIDLYSRLDEFIEYGHFETPEYLHETSDRYSEEIRRIREHQMELIKDRKAIIFPSSLSFAFDSWQEKKILDGQIKLMLSAFNLGCDVLIGRVSPSNYARTLDQIVKLANWLEKSAATLYCGFNQQYVEYKLQECELQYQFKLKKQEEQEEQQHVREHIGSDQEAMKECDKAVYDMDMEECMYRGY